METLRQAQGDKNEHFVTASFSTSILLVFCYHVFFLKGK